MNARMKKYVVYILIAAVVVALAVGVYVFRNVSQEVETVDQTATPAPAAIAEEAPRLRKGSFGRADSIHSGSGTATVVKMGDQQVVKFENFEVTQGPDLFVYLSKNNFDDNKDPGEFVSLGRLQSTSGDQAYTLPANADEYTSVVVWCRAFTTAFSGAVLR